MRLIDNWREWPKMYSQWAFATIATIQGSILLFVSEDILAAPILFFPDWTWAQLNSAVIAFLAVTGGVLRLVAQPAIAPQDPSAQAVLK